MNENIDIIKLHSGFYAKCINSGEIEFMPDSSGDLVIPTYLGKRIIIDDRTPE